jgi:hypothetical protein
VRKLPIRLEKFLDLSRPSVPMVPIEKSDPVPSKIYPLNPAVVRVFVYGLARSGKRLSLKLRVAPNMAPDRKIPGCQISSR